MKLKQWLNENKGLRVKIGSGGGYFYCDEVKGRKTLEIIKEIDAEYIATYRKNLLRYIEKSKKETLTKKARKEAEKNILRLTNKIENYTSLLTREVLETYESIQLDEVGVINVRIVGDENGKFWTMKEYEFYKVKKEKGYKYAKKTVRLRLPPVR